MTGSTPQDELALLVRDMTSWQRRDEQKHIIKIVDKNKRYYYAVKKDATIFWTLAINLEWESPPVIFYSQNNVAFVRFDDREIIPTIWDALQQLSARV